MLEMSDKEIEEKKKIFLSRFTESHDGGLEAGEYHLWKHDDSANELWQWIAKLVEEVEESLSQNSDFLLKATRDLEQKSCNHMTNLEYYNGTIQCTRCYKFLTGKEYIKVLNNCGIGN